MAEAGLEPPKPLSARKKFQFGGRSSAVSTARVMVPLVLGNTMVEAEVFIVDKEIPFLLGGEILRQHKTEISVSENKLTVNGHTMRLRLLNTGHMAIPWSPRIHKMKDHANNVFLTQRVNPMTPTCLKTDTCLC
jgi:hypothetical protein